MRRTRTTRLARPVAPRFHIIPRVTAECCSTRNPLVPWRPLCLLATTPAAPTLLPRCHQQTQRACSSRGTPLVLAPCAVSLYTLAPNNRLHPRTISRSAYGTRPPRFREPFFRPHKPFPSLTTALAVSGRCTHARATIVHRTSRYARLCVHLRPPFRSHSQRWQQPVQQRVPPSLACDGRLHPARSTLRAHTLPAWLKDHRSVVRTSFRIQHAAIARLGHCSLPIVLPLIHPTRRRSVRRVPLHSLLSPILPPVQRPNRVGVRSLWQPPGRLPLMPRHVHLDPIGHRSLYAPPCSLHGRIVSRRRTLRA